MSDINVEFTKRWIAALRSGRYPQITGALRNQNGFCAMGVAYDVAGSTWAPHPYEEGRLWACLGEAGNEIYTLLNLAGLSAEQMRPVPIINDNGGGLLGVADYLESLLPKAAPDRFPAWLAELKQRIGVTERCEVGTSGVFL